jgi:hypothetical protein
MNFKFLMILIVSVSLSLPTFAQNPAGNQSSTQAGPRKQLSTIFLAGMAGAVLGLSTLSFYGRPQDKLGNIAIGFAIGAVVGTVYTTYDTATQPDKYYGDFDSKILEDKYFAQKEKMQIPLFAYQMDF